MNEKAPYALVEQLADAVGGKLDYVSGPLPDGSGFATMSLPLPANHWLMVDGSNEPPMPFRIGEEENGLNVLPRIRSRQEFAEKLREAAKYAIRASTMNGKIIDFDPDAMLQNFVVGMLGYWTPNALSSLDGDDETTPRPPSSQNG